jgi:lipopolysaccharide export system permease protein
LFDIDGFLMPLKRLFGKKEKAVIEEPKDIIPAYSITEEQLAYLDSRSINQLKDIVKNYRDLDYPEDLRWAAIDKLSKVGITLENLKSQGFY